MSEKALDPNFLAEYERESEWAPGHGISQRTASRYRALPNGLPFLIFGGSVWIPKAKAASGSPAACSGAMPVPVVVKPRKSSTTPPEKGNG